MLTQFLTERDRGFGTANITTSSVFDREKAKTYELPIVMWDMRGQGGSGSMTGTNTLTIVIGDVNDNEHFPGHQDIFVYNYKGELSSMYTVKITYTLQRNIILIVIHRVCFLFTHELTG